MDDNRSRLLDCALDLFAARGYDAVGVQEVVEAAGITKPTLYHYFGSKGGLLRTLLDEGFAPLFAALEPACAYDREVAPSLRAAAGVYFSFARRSPRFYRMQLSMSFAPLESGAYQAIRPLYERQQAVLEAFFARAEQDHGNMRGRKSAYAASFLGMLNTYIALGLSEGIALDEELTRRAVHQFMHGIFS